MVELWLTSRNLSNPTNYDRPILSNTLLTRHLLCILLNCTHYSRRKLWLDHPLPSRQRRLHTFYLSFPTRRPRSLLWLIPPLKNLKHRHHTSSYNYSNSLHGLCTPMRPDIILGGNSNHKSTISSTIHRNESCSMNLRRIRHWQPHPHTILYHTLYITFHYSRPYSRTLTVSTRNRIKQPLRNLFQPR